MSDSKHEAVIGVFRRRSSADACFNDLLRRGYLSSDINIMMSTHTRSKEYAWTYEIEATEMARPGDIPHRAEVRRVQEADAVLTPGTTAGDMAIQGVGVGGSIGTAVGATLAAIAAVGTSLVIPGLNLIIAGPIMAALAGGGAGALAGGLVGGLVGLGIPEQDAEVYNEALRQGGVVLSVRARHENVEDLKTLMIEHSGEQVSSCKC